jgi:hypothetical protein
MKCPECGANWRWPQVYQRDGLYYPGHIYFVTWRCANGHIMEREVEVP